VILPYFFYVINVKFIWKIYWQICY